MKFRFLLLFFLTNICNAQIEYEGSASAVLKNTNRILFVEGFKLNLKLDYPFNGIRDDFGIIVQENDFFIFEADYSFNNKSYDEKINFIVFLLILNTTSSMAVSLISSS